MKKPDKRILIIDDEPLLLELIFDIFLEEKWIVEKAENGLEALNKMETFQPNVILSDVNMPKMDGLKFLDTLFEQGSLIPVVFLSGFRDNEKMKRAWAAGAFEFLDKPFDRNKVVEVCMNAFEMGEAYVKVARKRYEKLMSSKNKTVA
jgi:two-component system OmpR family response regulator